jgi:hypothetical protein
MVTAMGGSGVTGLGTASVMSAVQVTENGSPLYRFSKDTAPGDTNGEGISSFGGAWHVAMVAGKTAATPPPGTMPPISMSPPPSGTIDTTPPPTGPIDTTPPTTASSGYGGY